MDSLLGYSVSSRSGKFGAVVPLAHRAQTGYAKGVRVPAPAVLIVCLAASCSTEEPVTATIVLTAGLEDDAFTREPAPARLELHAVATSGSMQKIVDTTWPAGGFSIGEYDPNQVFAFEAAGKDTTGQTILRGATIYHALWLIDGTDVPLFMARVGEIGRPDGLLPIAREGGVAAIVDGRFIVSAGGSEARNIDGTSADPATISAYDLGQWTASSVKQTLPRTPESFVMVLGRYGLFIDDAGASWFDFATYDSADAVAPDGMEFGEVAGGLVVPGDEETYVVGPARSPDAPSTAVLRVATDGTLSVARLATARSGAAAAYVSGRGLVIAGGHETEPGVLLLQPEASAFAALGYPADPVRGAGAADIADERLVLAGGFDDATPAPSRVIDLTCLSACAATEIGTGLEPLGLTATWIHATSEDEVIAIGADAADGTTAVTRIGGLRATPFVEDVPLKEPRRGAVPVRLFGRAIALVGGLGSAGEGVHTLEVYMPK